MAGSGWDEYDAPEAGHRASVPLYLAMHQAGVLLLACVLFGLANGGRSGSDLGPGTPFVCAVLALWSILIILGCLDRRDGWLRARIAGDFGCSLVLVWWTGGVESFFVPILCANVLLGSTVLGMRQAVLLASTATVTLSVMMVLAVVEWSPTSWVGPAPPVVRGREAYFVSVLVGQGIAMHLVAFLGARLTGRLRSAMFINDLIVRNMGEGVVATDTHGRMILINREALKILDYPPDTRWRGLRPEEVFRRIEDRRILEVFATRAPELVLEWQGTRERSFPLSVRVREIPAGSRHTEAWVALLRDETLERRAANAEARVKMLEELEDMACGLAHEIRNPLGAMRGCVQELCGRRLSAEQEEKLAAVVLREADRLDRIVSEFMNYSRSAAAAAAPVDLVTVLNEAVESLRQRPDAAGMRITVDNRSAATTVVVEGQRELLYRAFYNLGVNGVEACAGKGSVTFTIADAQPCGWTISVRDDGAGMDEEVRRRAFHPFFTTKPREGGLGLSIVEKVVRTHGGRIEVESAKGIGTTMTVWLPPRGDTRLRELRQHALAGASE